ncbi:MAG: hypothetical protein LWW95_11650 [Candidatus Desulfofervidus auxilii]|nr:hypothetical protein [Candidatus Desulfofervidus auxilii]
MGIFCSIIVLVAVLSSLITPVYKSTFLVKVPIITETSLATTGTPKVSIKVPIITPDETKSLIEIINNFLRERNYEKLKKFIRN